MTTFTRKVYDVELLRYLLRSIPSEDRGYAEGVLCTVTAQANRGLRPAERMVLELELMLGVDA
jgi:hypothetical protein